LLERSFQKKHDGQAAEICPDTEKTHTDLERRLHQQRGEQLPSQNRAATKSTNCSAEQPVGLGETAAQHPQYTTPFQVPAGSPKLDANAQFLDRAVAIRVSIESEPSFNGNGFRFRLR